MKQQGRYLIDIWQQNSGRNNVTPNTLKKLITGMRDDLQLSGENWSNWVLLVIKLYEENDNRTTDETDHTLSNGLGGNE